MALSEAEKDWLERRKKNEKEYGSVFCPYCEQFIAERDEYIGPCYDDLYCPLTDHLFLDAAEFNARVAEKLARNICIYCPDALARKSCPSAFEYPRRTGESCRLMHARLAAEAEMDK